MNRRLLKNGLIAAAIMNIGGVLIFSRAFTNVVINNTDPVVMSNFGLLMILIWGLAYLGAACINAKIKWLIGSFAVEKLCYVVVWFMWQSKNNLDQLFQYTF
jgi:hypothetical protein